MSGLVPSKVLLLVTTGRAGSIFFQQLLDGHPQVVQFPAQTGIYQTRLREHFPSTAVAFDELAAFGFLRRHFNGVGDISLAENPERDAPRAFALDEHRFRQCVLESAPAGPISRRDLVGAVARGYARYAGLSPKDDALLLEHVHNPGTLAAALQDFPNAVVINTLREPVTAIYSVLRQYQKEFGVSDPRHFHVMLREQVTGWALHECPEAWGLSKDRYLGIYTEELNAKGEQMMPEIARWLGIEMSEVLLQPSLGGKPNPLPWGIKPGARAFRGVQPQKSKVADYGADDTRKAEMVFSVVAPSSPYPYETTTNVFRDAWAFFKPPQKWFSADVAAHAKYARYQLEFLPVGKWLAQGLRRLLPQRLSHSRLADSDAVDDLLVPLLAAKHAVVDPIYYHVLTLLLTRQLLSMKNLSSAERAALLLRQGDKFNRIAKAVRTLQRFSTAKHQE